MREEQLQAKVQELVYRKEEMQFNTDERPFHMDSVNSLFKMETFARGI